LSWNPETQQWIPAFAGMTNSDNYFLETVLLMLLFYACFCVILLVGEKVNPDSLVMYRY